MMPCSFRQAGRFVFALAIGVLLQPALAMAVSDRCTPMPDVAGNVSALPQMAKALKPGGQLSVLAVGSATLFGPDASARPGNMARQVQESTVKPQPIEGEASEQAFPRQMAKALQAAVPGLQVSITVRGGRGMMAADMLELLRKELAATRYNLVLWQTGTVEAVRNAPPGEFAQTLSAGAEAVAAAGADLILIDPQYSRFLQTNSNLDPYNQALQQVASMPGVLLFHRFDLMKNWAGDGQIDLERTPKADRARIGAALHACLGLELARMVLAAAQP